MANDSPLESNNEKTGKMQVNINVEKQPAIYTDAVLISSDPHNFGVVFNFAQHMGDQMHVVARVGMSPEHAHNFLETLNNHLGQFNSGERHK